MIAALCIALLAAAAFIFKTWNDLKKARQELLESKLNEVLDEAKKKLDSKSTSELVDDINTRYGSHGNGD